MSVEKNETCVFTIVSRNYLHYARTLMESVRCHAPEVARYVVLCDQAEGLESIPADCFTVLPMHDLTMACLDDMISKYTVLELNTAIKPAAFLHLYRERSFAKVIYFDPDIRLYKGMDELSSLLDAHDVVLTPHLTAPIEDTRHPDEVTFLQCGTYNLGFIGTRWSEETEQFLQWWDRKMVDQCSVDLPHGLFVDQKWINQLPGYYDRVHVCRHPGWNVAYWNLMHRTLEHRDGGVWVNGHPLFFFHFSGVTADGKVFSKYQDRFTMMNLAPVTRQLVNDYCAALRENGADEYGMIRYGYGRFPSGRPIPDFIRRIYRDNRKLAQELGTLTSTEGEGNWLGYAMEVPRGYEILNRAALALYEMRIDLTNTFPDLPLGNELPYANWFADNGAVQPDMPVDFVAPVTERLAHRKRSLFPPRGTPGRVGPRRLLIGLYRLVYQLAWRMQKLVYPVTTMAMRRRIHEFLANLAYGRKTTASRMQRHEVPTDLGLNVIGYLKAESGVGRAAQLTLDAALTAGIPLAIKHFELGCVSRREAPLPAGLEEGTPHAINLFHINADQIPIVHSQLGAGIFDGRYNIGYWYWEMPEFPDEWQAAFQHLNEIWVGSTFCQQSIGRSSPIPVIVMPPGLTVNPDERYNRDHFGLPPDTFCFLTLADGLSFLERKNPLGVVDAFRRAFPDASSNVRLVIKWINSSHTAQGAQAVREAIADDPRIVLVERYLGRREVDSLIQACDALVSLHRSEGFGLPLAEAMLLGKPVLATGWSANTDFMNEQNAYLVDYSITKLDRTYGPYRKGMHWADPDLEHAAQCMRTIHSLGPEVRQRAQRAQADLAAYWTPRLSGQRIKERLLYIRQHLTAHF